MMETKPFPDHIYAQWDRMDIIKENLAAACLERMAQKAGSPNWVIADRRYREFDVRLREEREKLNRMLAEDRAAEGIG